MFAGACFNRWFPSGLSSNISHADWASLVSKASWYREDMDSSVDDSILHIHSGCHVCSFPFSDSIHVSCSVTSYEGYFAIKRASMWGEVSLTSQRLSAFSGTSGLTYGYEVWIHNAFPWKAALHMICGKILTPRIQPFMRRKPGSKKRTVHVKGHYRHAPA